MGATAVLIRKELRQHWLPFGVLALLLALGALGVLVSHYLQGKSSSVFTGAQSLLQLALPAAAMLICGRLVVAEYRAKTQLFLEALPLSRVRMAVVKYLFGLGALLLFVAALLLAAGWMMRSHEAMTPRFAALLASRAAAAAWFWHAFFFTTGLLGRYRWPIYLLLFFAAFFVDTHSTWELQRFGPFELLNEQFGAEREHFPVAALRSTLACAAGFTAVGFVLVALREGNVSALLAEKMSYREKVFVGAILLGAIAAVSIAEEQKGKPPYDLRGAKGAGATGVLVKVAGPEEPAQALAREITDELRGLREFLGIATLPPVLVTQREDLDAGKYERAGLLNAEGFVLRANYTAKDFDRRRFIAWLIPELLDHRSHGRAALEPRRWVRDGLGEFWMRRARRAEPLAADRDLALRALYAAPEGLGERDLAAWYRTRERLGEGVATGLAWSGLRALTLARGDEACREFLRALYREDVPKDARATWREWRQPWPRVLRERAGISTADFLAAWNTTLATARHDLAPELAALPRLRLDVTQDAATSVTMLLRYQLSATPPPGAELDYRIRYLALPSLDDLFLEDDLHDEAARHTLTEPVTGEIAESFARGTRAVVGASAFLPALGCEAISGWQRLDLGP